MNAKQKKHEEKLAALRKAGNNYLQTEFSDDDATIMIFLHGKDMSHAIKGKAEDVGFAIFCAMQSEPLLLKIIEANLHLLEKEKKENENRNQE
ncbi:MAG: hypothetical protein LBK94_13145 [Prevotellaceae bacterium]|jgi:hypothetical protein|nr:hypothetical protein [Prevotellaceae bacterium]